MSAYVDATYYKDEYEGESVETKDFNRFAKRASEIVDQLTGYVIRKSENGLTDFDEFIQTQVKKATCAKIEYYQLEGTESAVTGPSESGGSFSLSKFSQSSQASTNRQAQRVSPAVLTYLEPTGLIKRKGVRLSVI